MYLKANFYEEDRHKSEGYKSISLLESGSVVKTVSDGFKLIEFQTATCSYRMGVPDMAYGKCNFLSTFAFVSFFVFFSSKFWMQLYFYFLK